MTTEENLENLERKEPAESETQKKFEPNDRIANEEPTMLINTREAGKEGANSSSSLRSNSEDPLEINLDQRNVSSAANSQENNAGIYFKEPRDGDLQINITNTNVHERQGLHFHKVSNQHYQNNLDPVYSDYLLYYANKIKEKFDWSRMFVINNFLASDILAMSIVERFLFEDSKNESSQIYSCIVNEVTYGMEFIIDEFQKYQVLQFKKFKKQKEPVILIVHSNPEDKIQTNEYIRSLAGTSGVIDTLISALIYANVYIIYVCKDDSLFKKKISDRMRGCVVNISELHLHLYFKLGHDGIFETRIKQMEIAISEYGWLSDFETQEKKAKIEALISKGSLEKELTKWIEDGETEETTRIINFASNQLQSIVLFVTAFFPSISTREFDDLVKKLIGSPFKNKSSFDAALAQIQDQIVLWECHPDMVLDECKISMSILNKETRVYKFISESKTENTKRIFLERYSLKIKHFFDIIEEDFLLSAYPVAAGFMEDLADLVSIIALSGQDQLIISVCEKITNEISKESENEQQSKTLFNRLLVIILKCNENSELQNQLAKFYFFLRQNSFRRNILAALLTYTCDPYYPNNLNFLKTYLDGSGKEEEYIKDKTIRIIAVNYANRFSEYLDAIEKWNDNKIKENLPYSFWFAKTSLLLLYHEKRFLAVEQNDYSYLILDELLKNQPANHLRRLANFLFASNCRDIFNAGFGEIIREQLRDERFLSKTIDESMFLCFAFILIQWKYLLGIVVIKRNSDEEPMVDQLLEIPVSIIIANYGSRQIKIALARAIIKLEIIITKERDESSHGEKRNVQALKEKWKAARVLLRMSGTTK